MGLFDLFKSKPQPAANEGSSDGKTQTVPFEVLRDDGLRAMKMGEVPFAAKCFAAALELRDDLPTLSYLAEAQIRMNDYPAARPTLERLVAEAPDNLTLHLLLSRTLDELNDPVAMKTAAEAALALDGNSAPAHYYAAKASFRLGDPFNAIAQLTQLLEQHPDYAEGRSLRARILTGMYQYQEAAADTALLVEQQPDNEEYLDQHATVLAALGRGEEAEQCWKKILECNPFHREAVIRLCAYYESCSLRDRALALLDEAIELQPDFAEAYKLRGGIKLELHDKEGAAADLKKSMEMDPESAKKIDGEYSNIENRLNERFRQQNPYGF